VSLVLFVVLSYLVGSFPSAIVLGKLFRGVDVREQGSGNAGGTNAWRVLGWRIGLPVMVVDVAKGAVAAAAIPRIPLGSLPVAVETAALLCGLAAVLGHVYPVYTRFRGGKGVAAGAGMLLATAPLPAAMSLGVFALTVFISGRVSLASVLAALSLPVWVVLVDGWAAVCASPLLFALTACLALFIVITHRTNLARLLRGEERGFPKLQLWRRILGPRS
jgi:glycerol-3-phosphate acyltransferase PlsY